jgi:hypothetical protein
LRGIYQGGNQPRSDYRFALGTVAYETAQLASWLYGAPGIFDGAGLNFFFRGIFPICRTVAFRQIKS